MTHLEEIPLSFSFPEIPHTFLRGNRALIVLKDAEGKYVVGCKNVYPNGIYRLAGGGIEEGEDPTVAASRELEEELGISTKLEPLAVIRVHMNSPKQDVDMKLYLFSGTLQTGEMLHPSDDLDGVKHLTREEMNALVDRFYDLQDTDDMQWSLYGAVYGRVHEIALDATL